METRKTSVIRRAAALLCALDGMDRAVKLENELAQLKAENDRLLAENEKYRRKLNGKKA